MPIDVVASVILVGAALVVALAYAWTASRRRGRAGFSRVAKDGGSAFLGVAPMSAAYWAMDPVAKTLVQWKVSANAITFCCLLLGAAGGALLAFGHFGAGALVSALAALGDTLDGMVARESNTACDAGEVLDAAVDRYGEFFFLGGLALFFRGSALLLLAVLVATLGSFMVSYATAKAESLSVTAPRGSMRRAERAAYLILGTAASPLIAWVVPGGANAPAIFVVLVVGVVANASAVYRLVRIAELVDARERLRSPSPRPIPSSREDSRA